MKKPSPPMLGPLHLRLEQGQRLIQARLKAVHQAQWVMKGLGQQSHPQNWRYFVLERAAEPPLTHPLYLTALKTHLPPFLTCQDLLACQQREPVYRSCHCVVPAS